MKKTVLIALLLLAGCTGVPTGVEPVRGFEVERYLGRWYEIARLDHSFERGLENVSAEYRLRDDGGIDVLNRGYAPGSGEWKQAEGRAYFVGERGVGHLKVSFFGPFYSSYVVFELDPDYRHAFVSGYDRDYLWLLARTPEVTPALRERFVGRAASLGFPVEGLIWVDQAPAAQN